MVRGRRVIGNYVIGDQLGEGGMGAVYVAQHTSLDERLAVKVLLPQWNASRQIIERFVAEARAASAIKHPNIIKIVDTGQLEGGGEFFIAMEHLQGYPLDSTNLPLPIETALRILVQACDALQAAHQRGIIHRDLKPANLFVVPQPHNPLFVKVLDFGIAKLNDEQLAPNIKTVSQQAMGTPHYMSPEQARASKDVTHLTDIYALGVICYELVVGRRPYEPSGIADLVLLQHSGPPPDPKMINPALPDAWGQVIRSAMSVNPARRPQSAHDLAEMLIAATPRGVEIAREVGFAAKGATPTPASVAAPTLPLGPGAHVGTPPATTLSSTAGQTDAIPPPARARSRRVIAIIGATAVIAIGAVAAWRLSSRGDEPGTVSGDPTTAASPAAAGPTPPAAAAATTPAAPSPAPPPATPERASVRMTFDTEPPGALVTINGSAKGPAPVSIDAPAGDELRVEAHLEGYEPASVTIAATTSAPRRTLVLARTIATQPGAATKPSKRGGRSGKADRRSTSSAGNGHPEPTPTHVDPNDVGE